MEFDPRVSVEALAGGHVEGQAGTQKIISDKEVFDFILDAPANSMACYPNFDNILVSLAEAV